MKLSKRLPESMSNNAVDTPQDTQDIPTSDDTEIAPCVRKSRIGPPLAVNERLGIFNAIRQVPDTATGIIAPCFHIFHIFAPAHKLYVLSVQCTVYEPF